MATVASMPFFPSPSPRTRSRSPVKSTPASPELHRKTSSSSLSQSFDTGAGIPRPPSAADLRPNAHPYPIATTATGVLSRANSLSSPAGGNSGKHHYVPPSPAKEERFFDDGARDGGAGAGTGGGAKGRDERRRAEYRGHRYSRSLSSSEDMYLPSSPSGKGEQHGGSGNGNGGGGGQGPRALPVPPGVSANSIAAKNAERKGGYSAYAASGTSPKRWTPAQLAAHLNQTVSPEAAAWAARRNVGGKAFMRMGEMGEEEFGGSGAPPALRPAARALRQEVLENQIQNHTQPSPTSSTSDDEGAHGQRRSHFRYGSPTRGRVSAVYEEPGEIDEGDAEGEEDGDGTPSHRRRTMSVPVASPFTSSANSNSHARQSPFAARYEYPGARDGGEPSPSPSPSPTGRFRNGRVKGMVRSFESSGSESGSPERERERGSGFRGGGSGFRRRGSDAEDERDAVGGTVRAYAHQGQGQGQGQGRALPARPDGADAGVDLGATVRAPAPAYPHAALGTVHARNGFLNDNNTNAADDEELTVEELLAREDAVATGQPMTPSHTGGAWRQSKRGITPQSTGEKLKQHPTGGRPLPAHPASASAHGHAPAPHAQRTSSGGVHAWEADDAAVGSTMKWVPARPDVGRLFEVEAPTQEAEEELSLGLNLEDKAPMARARAEGRELGLEAGVRAARREEQQKREADAEERGRARGAAVRAQLAEAAELRGMVDAFRVRLEEVERKVGEMEVAAGDAQAKTLAAPAAPTTSSTPSGPLSVSQRLDPRRLLALFGRVQSGSAANKTSDKRGDVEDWVGPTTLKALPSYVLLVGLGVCAVVLRVLVRRGLGAVRGGRGAA